MGDSLGLSQKAGDVKQSLIVFCGVHFMAETASILCPDKKVLLPDPEAGCSLSDSLQFDQLKAWKERYPDAVVVTYVNTSAAVKSLSDYCVTSSNAVKVVDSIPPEKPVLFGPDMFLGAFVARKTGRKNIRLWAGECHVHAAVSPSDIENARSAHPGARFLNTPRMRMRHLLHDRSGRKRRRREDDLLDRRDGPRGGKGNGKGNVVATETGIFHRLKKASPASEFYRFPARWSAGT